MYEANCRTVPLLVSHADSVCFLKTAWEKKNII